VREDFTTASFGSPVLRGNTLYAPYLYQNLDEDSALAETVLVTVDVDTLQASILRDGRCGFTAVELAPSGDIYLTTAQQGASYHLVGRPAMPEPCLLRIRPDSEVIDPGFLVRHSSWTDGRPANDLVVVADDVAYVIEITPVWRTPRKGLLSSEIRQCRRESHTPSHSRKTPYAG
jgi:hypothetical protein